MKTKNTLEKSPTNWLVRVAWFVWGIFIFGTFAAMISIAVNRMQSGKGLDKYLTAWLVEDTSIDFLTFLAATVVLLAIGGFFRFKEWREVRKLEKKYSKDGS